MREEDLECDFPDSWHVPEEDMGDKDYDSDAWWEHQDEKMSATVLKNKQDEFFNNIRESIRKI